MVKVKDLAGNVSNTGSLNVSLDLTVPAAADLTQTGGSNDDIYVNLRNSADVTVRATLRWFDNERNGHN